MPVITDETVRTHSFAPDPLFPYRCESEIKDIFTRLEEIMVKRERMPAVNAAKTHLHLVYQKIGDIVLIKFTGMGEMFDRALIESFYPVMESRGTERLRRRHE